MATSILECHKCFSSLLRFLAVSKYFFEFSPQTMEFHDPIWRLPMGWWKTTQLEMLRTPLRKMSASRCTFQSLKKKELNRPRFVRPGLFPNEKRPSFFFWKKVSPRNSRSPKLAKNYPSDIFNPKDFSDLFFSASWKRAWFASPIMSRMKSVWLESNG